MAERDLMLPWCLIQRVLNNRLHMFPYKILIVRQLEDRDYAAWTLFVNYYRKKNQFCCLFFNIITFSNAFEYHLSTMWTENSTKKTTKFRLQNAHMNIEHKYEILKRSAFVA